MAACLSLATVDYLHFEQAFAAVTQSQYHATAGVFMAQVHLQWMHR